MQTKSVSLLGLGRSNLALIPHLASLGYKISLRDRRPKEAFADSLADWQKSGFRCYFGDGYLDNLCEDILFRSPILRPDLPQLALACARGAVLTSDVDYFFAACPAPIFGVTGSDGKTTTSTVLSLLCSQVAKTHLGGNIGTPLGNFIGKVAKEDFVVAELSSFQLMTLRRAPRVAVVTNLSPNHLDYHRDIDEYRSAKEQIFLQDGCRCAILNYDNADTRDMARRLPPNVACRFFGHGAGSHLYVSHHGGRIFLRGEPILDTQDLLVCGKHNTENFMAAIAACGDFITAEMVRTVARSFGGVAHRLEWVGEQNGVRFCNSSIDSTPTRTVASLEALCAYRGRIWVILGGYDKCLSFAPLAPALAKAAKGVVLQGATSDKIAAALQADADFCASGIPIHQAENLEKAVKLCKSFAKAGDIVLLSPACASFDAFSDFEQRGQAFCRYVKDA